MFWKAFRVMERQYIQAYRGDKEADKAKDTFEERMEQDAGDNRDELMLPGNTFSRGGSVNKGEDELLGSLVVQRSGNCSQIPD